MRTISNHPGGGFEIWFWQHYTLVDGDDWPWQYFTPYEMRCQKTGMLQVSPIYMDLLSSVRVATQIVMPVTSGFRHPEHNQIVSHTKSLTGPHPDSQAVDIKVARREAYEVQKCAMIYDFTGIGIKQHGDSRYLHLDTWYERPESTLWTYYEP